MYDVDPSGTVAHPKRALRLDAGRRWLGWRGGRVISADTRRCETGGQTLWLSCIGFEQRLLKSACAAHAHAREVINERGGSWLTRVGSAEGGPALASDRVEPRTI